MRLEWTIEEGDVDKIAALFRDYQDHPVVCNRHKRNVEPSTFLLDKKKLWQEMVICLLTSQQKSGSDSPVDKFAKTDPFPLNYDDVCKSQAKRRKFIKEGLTGKGIRFTTKLAEHIDVNFPRFEKDNWKEMQEKRRCLSLRQDDRQLQRNAERACAEYIAEKYKGFGPKQSRNLLQNLGFTLYEIPIDSRVTKWLNKNLLATSPLKLSAKMLADLHVYRSVLNQVQMLCDKCNLFPCLLDAAVLAQEEKKGVKNR